MAKIAPTGILTFKLEGLAVHRKRTQHNPTWGYYQLFRDKGQQVTYLQFAEQNYNDDIFKVIS